VALVGANGSGKSTLLKILTRVMYPFAGRLNVSGRVGALIEVRAGIHPELTGRENIALYGSLLGLGRTDVAKRFDEIVAFAELEDAVDRQVKFFSSGMYMRLGFAVAAFLEPDILLVDEVLAVGDAAFQQKCLDRMRTVLAQGTTLVFVSHDLAAVEATCSRGLLLDRGVVQHEGPIRDVLTTYRRSIEEMAEAHGSLGGILRLVKAEASCIDGRLPETHETLRVKAVVESPEELAANFLLGVSEGPATPIFVLRREVQFSPGENKIICDISELPLPRGRYYLWLGVLARKVDFLPWHPAASFDVQGPNLDVTPRGIVRLAPIHVNAVWNVLR
jgi:ABC-2 type transport system ATP-binding protein